MQNWLRASLALALGFGAVVVVTLGLAELIVSGAAGSAQDPGESAAESEPAVPNGGGPVTAVGGALAVTGDREGTFVLDRETNDNQGYSLSGEEGRIFFGGDPLAVDRVSYDGLEFYVDEGDCTLTPGERHDPTGVAGAEIRCEDIADIRDGGTISLAGTVGISADMVGLRGDMPHTGGTVQVGDRELELPFTVLFTGRPVGFELVGGFVPTDDGSSWLLFDYDFQTHALVLDAVSLDGIESEVPAGACTVTSEPIGILNPRTTTTEVTVECPSVELVGGERVRISGTLIADVVENP